MSRRRSSSTASLSAPGRTSGRGRSRPSSRSRPPAPPAARSRTRLRVSKPGSAEYTRPQVRQLPGGVSPPVAASSVAPIVGLSGLPASLPRTPSHSPDKPLNLRPDVLAVWWTEPRLRGSGPSSLTPVVASVVVGEPRRWAHDVRCPSHRPGARVEPLLLPASCCSFDRHGKDGLDQAVVARAAAEVAAEADTHVVLARCRDPSEERRCGDQHPRCAEAALHAAV